MSETLFDKIWKSHLVMPESVDTPAVLYVDLHLIHEVTSPQAFSLLKSRGLKTRRPDLTTATVDHSIPTTPPNPDGSRVFADEMTRAQVATLEANCKEHGIFFHGQGCPTQGIVHVIGPELGLTQPGFVVVCGDSHTATHGAFGALAFGIGTSEVSHVLATQCLLQRRPKTMRVNVNGELPAGVGAKDMVLAIIQKLGFGGGTGFVLEYTGEAIRKLNMEGRMTVCNMSIEAGARAGLISPDETTFAYLKGRPHAPSGKAWEEAVEKWKRLATDEGAVFDAEIHVDVSALAPMVTFGTNPAQSMAITQNIPSPDALEGAEREVLAKALDYMGLQAGKPIAGQRVDVVFIGSCTNSRIADLREAAQIFKGRKVAEHVRALVVPGSEAVKRQAEVEGLDIIFKTAGAQWREPGCSMCIAMNGDQLSPGQYAVSTSNRNFEGRQGKGGRTFLASPSTAAAAAVSGKLADSRLLT
ncbi:MAG: 3-isopropylmalate dehydratase large subunit [Proteobacteria bacterium]|nr:3-isopropylmalate dehydratase large subunit [Cystobacterineae bacterium]MCL2258479.1 3-isopropylmalate dehydratase large subunit [Cystobacterineae bacterium]MCL2315181.1 3-isopropylmalate dehydratase large subunit [Pseudomonadota bacterium]